jgi:hypothetical protein
MPTPPKVLLAGLATILVGGIAWAALPSPHEPAVSVRCPLPRTGAAATASPAESAPGGGGIRVVEHGFTQRDGGVDLGAVVENSSRAVAYRTLVRFRVLDAAGRSASAPESLSPQLVQEIPVILPGQRIGAGTFVYVAEKSILPTTYARVVSVELEIIATHWLPGDGGGFAAVTASELHIRRYEPTDPGQAIIDYTVASGYCSILENRAVAVVYRDASGRLIGGGLVSPQASGKRACSPGRYDQWIGVTVPPGADDARTEIYPYCDPAEKALAPSVNPFN